MGEALAQRAGAASIVSAARIFQAASDGPHAPYLFVKLVHFLIKTGLLSLWRVGVAAQLVEGFADRKFGYFRHGDLQSPTRTEGGSVALPMTRARNPPAAAAYQGTGRPTKVLGQEDSCPPARRGPDRSQTGVGHGKSRAGKLEEVALVQRGFRPFELIGFMESVH